MEPIQLHPEQGQPEQPTLPETYVLPDPTVETAVEPVVSKPPWYRRTWVKRTAITTVIVVLAGATVGLVQRTNSQADQIDSKTTQVTHLHSKLVSAQDQANEAEDRASSAESDLSTRKAAATRVSGEVATCVSQMHDFLQSISTDLSAIAVLGTPHAVDALPFTPAQAGTNCATARDDAASAAN